MPNQITQLIDNSREIPVSATDLQTKANSITQNYQQAFSNNLGSAQILSNIYSTRAENTQASQEFYQSYLYENAKLENILKENSSNSLTNNRKSYYEDQGIDTLKWWNALFFGLYTLLIIAYILFFFISSSSFGFISKIFILICLIAYIFITPRILKFLISLYQRLVSVLPRNAYLNI